MGRQLIHLCQNKGTALDLNDLTNKICTPFKNDYEAIQYKGICGRSRLNTDSRYMHEHVHVYTHRYHSMYMYIHCISHMYISYVQ